jgi:hypothetical protein
MVQDSPQGLSETLAGLCQAGATYLQSSDLEAQAAAMQQFENLWSIMPRESHLLPRSVRADFGILLLTIVRKRIGFGDIDSFSNSLLHFSALILPFGSGDWHEARALAGIQTLAPEWGGVERELERVERSIKLSSEYRTSQD